MIRPSIRAALALALATLAGSAGAVTYTWPNLSGVGACTGTLQACLSGATAGDTVQIGGDDLIFPDRYTTIDEDLVINRGVTLRPATGIDAVFAPDRGILVDTFAGGTPQIEISGLVFQRGNIEIRHRSTGEGTYRVERNRFNDVPPVTCAISLNTDSGVPRGTLLAGDNVIRMLARAGGRSSGICASSTALARQDVIFRNRIDPAPGSMAFGIIATGIAGGPVNVQGNYIVGSDFATGIQVGAFELTARYLLQLDNNVVSGQNATPSAIAASVQIISDNMDAVIVNNTLVHGRRGLEFAVAGFAPSLAGRIDNNVIAFHSSEGIVLEAPVSAGVTNRNNVVFGNPANTYTPGPQTQTVDPLLVSPTYPRLSDASPAVNAGNDASLPSFAAFDADGERRIALGRIDIGAYEASGDLAGVQVARSDNTAGNTTLIDRLNGLPNAIDKLQLTIRRTPAGGLLLRENVGVYLPSVFDWAAFFEDFTLLMPVGFAFNVIVPVGSKTGFEHLSTAANSVDDTTRIENAELNGRPFMIAAVTHRFPDGGSFGDYHDHPLGLEYFASRWYVRNQDLATMQFNRRFNIAVAPLGSSNAFRVRAPGTLGEVRLDHPLLDDNGCAVFVASRVDDPDDALVVANPTPFTVDYRAGSFGAPGRWFAVAEGDGTPTFPTGSAFNVIVDGETSNQCRAPVVDDLFANGFE